jgi:hypothetical protein
MKQTKYRLKSGEETSAREYNRGHELVQSTLYVTMNFSQCNSLMLLMINDSHKLKTLLKYINLNTSSVFIMTFPYIHILNFVHIHPSITFLALFPFTSSSLIVSLTKSCCFIYGSWFQESGQGRRAQSGKALSTDSD